MIVSFLYPSSTHRTGGVTVLYEFANGLVRQGHDVQFIHGPLTEHRVDDEAEIPFEFDHRVRHCIVDHVDDPDVGDSDIIFVTGAPPRLGLPCSFVQGHRMLPDEMERQVLLSPGPKVCVARWLIEVGRRHGVQPHRLWYVPPGLRHDIFTASTSQSARAHDVAVLYHPHHNKGWDTALTTLRLLRQRRHDLRSVVFGMRHPDDQLPDGTEFVLAPDHRQLVDGVYGASRVFLQASRVEGFGYTPVEAMACGAALVSTDNGGSADYALHNETALVTPIDEPAALADAVERLLDDDDLRARLATAGERHVRRFDWDVSAGILEHHLEEYLAEPARYQPVPSEKLEPADATGEAL